MQPVRAAGDNFRTENPTIAVSWSTAVGNDLRMSETVGPRNAAVSAITRPCWTMLSGRSGCPVTLRSPEAQQC